MSNLTKILFFNLACKNAPMNYNWRTLALCLALYARKYFKVLMEDVGDQVSPTISLFWKSPLTTIIKFNLSRFPSDWILDLYTSMHGVTGSPYFWSSIRKVWLLIIFFIYLIVAFSQGFLMFYGIFFASAKFIGYGNEMVNFWTRFSQSCQFMKNLFYNHNKYLV